MPTLPNLISAYLNHRIRQTVAVEERPHASVSASRQEEVMAAIRAISADGWPASTSEIADALKWHPTEAVYVLKELEKQGRIEANPRRPRTKGIDWRIKSLLSRIA